MVDRIHGEPPATPQFECDGCRRGLPTNDEGQHYYRSNLVEGSIVTLPCTAPAGAATSDDTLEGVGGFSRTDTKMMLKASIAALREVLPPTVAIALFLVDVNNTAFKTDGPKTVLYEGLAAWAKNTLGKEK